MPIDEFILKELKDNDLSLTELDLSSENLKDSDIQALIEALSKNTTLTTLNVEDNQIGDEGAKVLAKNTTLTTLNVVYNQIGIEGAKALAQNTTLTALSVGYNQIRTEGAKALAQNTTLTALEISSNQIGDEGAKALAQNTILTALEIDYNQIGTEGAKALAQNTTLTSLNIEENQIGDEGAKALVQNTTLTTLKVMSNQIGDEWNKKLKQVIRANQRALMVRRQQWFYNLLLLITAIPQPSYQDNVFPWAALPKELKLTILNFIEFKGTLAIGKTKQQHQKAIKFIFDNQAQLKSYWQEKRSIKLIETKTPEGLYFSFRSKPLSIEDNRKRSISKTSEEPKPKRAKTNIN